MLRAFVVAGLTLLALLLGAAPASAHATLLTSDPTEGAVLPDVPDVVTFTFDEPVSLPSNGVQVFDAAGEPVEARGTSRDEVITTDLPDALDDGSYVVVWRAISADGHPIAGSLTFSIGAPSPVVEAPRLPDVDPAGVRTVLSITQALGYVGLLVAVGLALFLIWTVRGVRIAATVRERLVRVAWSAAGLALLASACTIPLSGAYQQGLALTQLGEADAVDPALIGDDVVVFGLQAVGLILALSVLSRPRVATAGALVAGLSPVLVGHSRAIEPVWLLVTTDALHLAAGATWLGGLIGLTLTLGSLSGRERDAALVLSRVSAAAATALALLAITGTLMGAQILGGWSPLFETTYGRLLLVKVAIAALVAGIAGFNRFRLLPGVREGGHSARRSAAMRVRRVVRVEAGMLVVLLGVTGFLTNQSPRAVESARAPVPSRVSVGLFPEAKVLATVSPGRRGPNTVTIQVQDDAGEPLDAFAEPSISIRSADDSVDLGPQAVTPAAAGTYTAEVVLPTAGTWVIQVSLRISEFDNPVTSVEITVR